MNTFSGSMWQRASVRRVLAIGAAVAIGVFVLFVFLCSLGDSDLPPYDPPFPGERACWMILGVIEWPLVLAAWIIGRDPPGVFWLPLFFFAGLFWAMLFAVCIMIKHARDAPL